MGLCSMLTYLWSVYKSASPTTINSWAIIMTSFSIFSLQVGQWAQGFTSRVTEREIQHLEKRVQDLTDLTRQVSTTVHQLSDTLRQLAENVRDQGDLVRQLSGVVRDQGGVIRLRYELEERILALEREQPTQTSPPPPY